MSDQREFTDAGDEASEPSPKRSDASTDASAPPAGTSAAAAGSEPVGEDAGDMQDRVVGDFRLLRLLGSGGMAEVYLAEQLSLGRRVAVKVLARDALGGRSSVTLKRFEQEARAAGGLSHANIVQVYSVGSEDNLHYIAQEYVPGVNLRQWTRRHGAPEFETGLEWMIQAADALRAAAAAGIVHRDMKPENMLVTPEGELKVVDFGLAQLTGPAGQMSLTQTGTTMGTPWYMSPEQVQGQKLDHRSDQYSLGVAFFHVFAGRPPFPGRNMVSVAVQHVREQAPELRQFRRELPPAFSDIIHRMMAKSPDDRYQTPEEVLSALKALRGVPIRKVSDFMTWQERVAQYLPITPGALSFIAAAAVFIGFTAWFLNQSPELQLRANEFPRESTAVRQFATALMQPPPGNESAWQAVLTHYPETREAAVARIHLGCLYLRMPTRPAKDAETAFREALNEATVAGPGQDTIRILAQVGLAYLHDAELQRIQSDSGPSMSPQELRARMNVLEDSIRRIRDVELKDFSIDELQEVLESSPEPLRSFSETFLPTTPST